METVPRVMIDSVVRSVCGDTVERLVPLTGGGLNEAYRADVVGDRSLVVRIARRPEPWFTAEAHLMAQARRAGVPTPEVLGIEQVEHDGALLSFSILRFVPGRPLDELVGVLSPTELDRLLMDGGELLARLHSVEAPHGTRAGSEGGAGIEHGAHHLLEPPDGFLAARVVDVAEQAFGSSAATIVEHGVEFLRNQVTTRPAPNLALAHGDFLPKHLVIDQFGTIGAVIDWEFAGWASPALDLAHWEVAARSGLHIHTDLVRRGYRRVASPELRDDGWVPAYCIHFALDVLSWENPASPERLRRCVEVIARHVGG